MELKKHGKKPFYGGVFMKIAICSDSSPEEYTAAAAYLSVLEKGLRKKGHTVKLFCASPTQRRLRVSHEIAILPGKYTIDFFESTAKLFPLFPSESCWTNLPRI